MTPIWEGVAPFLANLPISSSIYRADVMIDALVASKYFLPAHYSGTKLTSVLLVFNQLGGDFL